ncbi:Glycogen debranching enzyme [Planktothrix serta PCC 8927]|uniref:Glycogen debranching enzyme n=1 Tax=Planktothrix serta PCC 8927 TaxID=671068 RepID=A0A7Z9BM59_9CYAN|nr:amylo-alpha-1,6-glucosidase [Planktothrix serta]VXD17695.1 Glycogen debranching enzyme [Planktothrix serta PCC 8927]
MISEKIEFDGRVFVPAEEALRSQWPCAVNERPQPTLTLKDDDLFLITDTLGNITQFSADDRQASLGLFCHDTRFLSRLELQISGQAPILLSGDAQKGFALSVLCANPKISDQIPAETIGIEREIILNGGLFEAIKVTNYSTSPVQFEISLSFGSDFVDLFQIRGFNRDRQGRLFERQIGEPKELEEEEIESQVLKPENEQKEINLAYQGLDGSFMESRIQFVHNQPDFIKENTALWQFNLKSHETQIIGYSLQMLTNNRPTSAVHAPLTLVQAKAAELMEEKQWQNSVTRIRSNNRGFNRVIEQAEQDIYLLRQTFGKEKGLSAGVPWFSCLFGRDSIIAASQTLILDPEIARSTLNILAQYQGQTYDDWRDEEPGKILHELRMGEMARCQEIPHTPYYGTVDATPLWLMLYSEYFAWTQDTETLEKLWQNARAAMDWIDAKSQENGYLCYFRKSSRGLVNQGWKDSGDCIVKRDGTLANAPIALCEVQAYVYAAKVRMAEIAKMRKRIDLADRWQEEARQLKMRFNRDFWLKDQDFCALALDGEGQPVDSISSNPGHCLQLGILTPENAKNVAERLLAPDMFSGWGIRTLSSLSPAYNPMGYHTGSVWPHDNSLIALGLRSIGFIDPAFEVAQGLFDMTMQQPLQRPPELFCGFPRIEGTGPVKYPVACSPQAWASGSMFQLLQMMMNLVPDASSNYLRIIDPSLPESISHISVHNLKIGSTVIDLEFERDKNENATACRVLKKRGNLRVMIEA